MYLSVIYNVVIHIFDPRLSAVILGGGIYIFTYIIDYFLWRANILYSKKKNTKYQKLTKKFGLI